MASNTPTYITPSASPPRSHSNTPIKPTLLAFHGSGSNATIHTVQLARLTRNLKTTYDIISCEAPFPSAAGPGILPFFEGCGPFKRWIPPQEKVTISGMKAGEASDVMPPEVEEMLREQVREVREAGSRVVGVIGFSQGTRVVAGMLKGAEIRRAVLREGKEGDEETEWLADISFGVSVCGSYPPALIPASATNLLSRLPEEQRREMRGRKIQLPTLHAQGKQDEWEWAGQMLIDGTYEVGLGKSEVRRFEMGHHYPVAPEETEQIREWMVEKSWTPTDWSRK